jgi:CSLREA domain-containing protein
MRRTTLRLVFLVAVTASLSLYGLVGMQSASAAIITVTTPADENDDPGPETGCSLREAIIAANTDEAFGGCDAGDGADNIVLPAGTYELSISGGNPDLEGDLDIEDESASPSSDVTIEGAGASTTIIMQTVADERVIDIDSGGEFVVTLSGVTVTGGTENGDGGGIHNDGQTLNLLGVDVTVNASTGDGGGIFNEGGAVLVMMESSVTGNTAEGQGGGLQNDAAAAELTNVTISGNSANDDGGGLNNDEGTTTATLQNVTVTGNTADADADGSGNGGGIDQDGDPVDSQVTLNSTIVAGNTDASTDAEAPDCADVIASTGHNLIGDDTGCDFSAAAGDLVGTGTAPIDPMLGPLALNGGTTPNHELLAGSPAIDAGDPAAAPPIDQRGFPRDALPDIGAFEVQAPAVTCKGKAATITGTPGNDVLVGTAARDIVAALAGKDKVKTKGGKDLVCAGKGKDRVNGGGKNDKLLGQGGNDRLKGAGGNDKLRGGKGKDRCNGGPGIDKGNCEVEINIP